MKRKTSKPYSALQVRTQFPIYEICGTWESLCGSPGLKVFHDGSRFRLQFIYKHDTAFTVPLCQSWGITFFYFYGMIRIAYDDERDMLLLTTEGEYKRVYD
ncbi:hypothetical protein M2451_003127 [Dysgonomonas sp. PFB1-18]|uniref:DUF3876 domain-containing protein n=1 Tax=unclassified Dysgonomonas TaxID=2630389 RepID=UPI0013D6D74E|nr:MULTISPECIES: DUF3876 domain-containing protein [unclassified Dysgonomonas]MDH6310283.1 hypothetical protein [Dysgonomonas sp. PF1-14]MDH6340100.1 hypothetical protein [Dysgonomonas sp. PF1-16]MDH6381792.1 hypothetical protein [Dysgonomonas sp. PFB1-18]MDH6398966.1 hypothetical protein [Dysgonomonas sp. PF1-23]NDV93366.1 DUF3876 domain-containing protein [Dysgonomonas sp. 521]